MEKRQGERTDLTSSENPKKSPTAKRLAKQYKVSRDIIEKEHTMADNYRQVMQEVERRLASLVAKQADLTEADAWSAVFKADPQLYRRYREASEAEPAPASGSVTHHTQQTASVATAIEQEIESRVERLLLKSSGLSQVDALAEVMKDPELYRRYREQGEGTGLTSDDNHRKSPTPSPDVPLPAWQPPDPTLHRFIPADVQRAVLKALI